MSYFRFKATIAYDGTNYYGFEKQGELPTIEKEIVDAFYKWLNKEIKIVASGRTDRFVHARGQVIHFDLEQKLETTIIKKALNSFLPKDIKVINIEEVNSSFHARFSVIKKEYHYVINKNDLDVFKENYSYYCYNLNLNKMEEASKYLIGEHNFKSFASIHTNQLKDFNRIIYNIEIIENSELIIFKFIGNGFLKYQVRRMMGLLVEIGKNRYEAEYMKEILELEDPRSCQYILPGKGLYLDSVYYK